MSEHMLWVEKYRPKKIQDCILPDALKNTFQEFVNKKEIPNLLLSGTAGVGKTTIAKALCEEVDCDYIVINGSDENGVDVIRNKIKTYASSVSLSGGRKVIIIDEADYLNANSTQPAMRGAIEEFSNNRGSSVIVVDEKGKPVGRILADDIIDAMVSEENTGLAQGTGALS